MSYWRGHSIKLKDGRWVYDDDLSDVAGNGERPCGHCAKMNTEDGHDGCIGKLENVMNACCGHGNTSEAYVQYNDGRIVRKVAALLAQRKIRMKDPTTILTYSKHSEQVGVVVQGYTTDGTRIIALEFDKVVRGGLLMSTDSARKFANMLLQAASPSQDSA